MEYFKKINLIRDFLKTEFQNDNVSDTYDSELLAQTFTIQDENRIYLVSIRRSFIDNVKLEQMSATLKSKKIRDYFQSENTKRVIVGTSEIKTEDV